MKLNLIFSQTIMAAHLIESMLDPNFHISFGFASSYLCLCMLTCVYDFNFVQLTSWNSINSLVYLLSDFDLGLLIFLIVYFPFNYRIMDLGDEIQKVKAFHWIALVSNYVFYLFYFSLYVRYSLVVQKL